MQFRICANAKSLFTLILILEFIQILASVHKMLTVFISNWSMFIFLQISYSFLVPDLKQIRSGNACRQSRNLPLFFFFLP